MNSTSYLSDKFSITEDHRSCVFCHTFVSSTDGHAAIKDPTLGGTHQSCSKYLFQRFLAEHSLFKQNPSMTFLESYKSSRKMLVDWLISMRGRLGLSDGVPCLATKYMDYINADKDYSVAKYQLIAYCCLCIAAKFVDVGKKADIPENFPRLAAYPSKINTLSECEVQLFKMLNWKLKISTSYDLVRCLLAQGILFDDDVIDDGDEDIKPREDHAIFLTRFVQHLAFNSIRSII